MLKTFLVLVVTLVFFGCSNRDDGINGRAEFVSLTKKTALIKGDENCFKGGVRIDTGSDVNANSVLDTAEIITTNYLCSSSLVNSSKSFNRIASFPICRQLGASCNKKRVTAAEIVAASSNGMTLIYTDSPASRIGFVDISNPAKPRGLGALAMVGKPTSVAVMGRYALVGVNRSEDFVDVAGSLTVVDIATQKIVRTIDVGGQPDSVAVSPDGAYAAVIIENEQDKYFGDGARLQAGYLVVVTLTGPPATWATTTVDMTGTAALYPKDPEPEHVDINNNNIAVVTLQENNHIVLVDLASATVTQHFSAGSVSLTQIDTQEQSPTLVSLTDSQTRVLREPDGVSWINNHYFSTADEGGLDGGSRTFSIFNVDGEVVYHSGSALEHMAVRFGHYPDGRSGNRGNEPESIEVSVFGSDRYLFVGSERSSLIFVYDVADPTRPIYKQALPAALEPEGLLAIPSRNLLIAASEKDARKDRLRSALNIYSYTASPVQYPTLVSADRTDGTPIPWSAISGLAASSSNKNMLYAVDDNFYQRNRIFAIDIGTAPAQIVEEIPIKDSNDVLSSIATQGLLDTTVADNDSARVAVFDSADLALLINADKTINADPEGIAVANDGGFWIASEGAGTRGDAKYPVKSLNWVLKTNAKGIIEQVFSLPYTVNALQERYGFEGIAEYKGKVYTVMQRPWRNEAGPRISVLDPSTRTWAFYTYPLETAVRGWVGLSDITSVGGGTFLVVERDNQGGPDAKIKRLYRFDVTGLNDGDTITKTLVRDLLPALKAPGGLVYEKIEGVAVTRAGQLFIVNDNDGLEANSGETQLLNIGSFQAAP